MRLGWDTNMSELASKNAKFVSLSPLCTHATSLLWPVDPHLSKGSLLLPSGWAIVVCVSFDLSGPLVFSNGPIVSGVSEPIRYTPGRYALSLSRLQLRLSRWWQLGVVVEAWLSSLGGRWLPWQLGHVHRVGCSHTAHEMPIPICYQNQRIGWQSQPRKQRSKDPWICIQYM